MNLFRPSNRPVTSPKESTPQTANRNRLVRSFIETGDERCPLAAIWSCLTDDGALVEESELIRPALWKLFLWRALYFPSTLLLYSVP